MTSATQKFEWGLEDLRRHSPCATPDGPADALSLPGDFTERGRLARWLVRDSSGQVSEVTALGKNRDIPLGWLSACESTGVAGNEGTRRSTRVFGSDLVRRSALMVDQNMG